MSSCQMNSKKDVPVTFPEDSNNIAESKGTSPNACICNRKITGVVCGACGYSSEKLRSRKTCSVHPQSIFLMDHLKCPNCHKERLTEC